MSKKNKKVYGVLNYIEQLLILISTVTGCISISSFASLVGILRGITSFAIGLKICVIAAGIRKYNSIIKKKKKKHDKILLLAKSENQQNSVKVLISKALIESTISHDEFILINNVRKEFDDIKKEIRNSNDE